MLPAELKFFKKPLGYMQLEASWASLLRIAAWTLLFLLAAKWVLSGIGPEPVASANTGDPRITPMLVRSNDPLWVRQEPSKFPANGLMNIAWVSGSAGKLVTAPPVHVASYALDALEQQSNIKAEVFSYYMQAARLTDALVSTQDAIRRNPDVLVIELDPLWIYNLLQVYRSSSVFNGAATLWWNSRDWPKQFLFVAPRNHWWGWTGNYIPRFPIDALPKRFESFIAKPAKAARKGGNRQPTQGVMFWTAHRDFPGLPRQSARDIADVELWQNKLVLMADTQPGTWAYSNAQSMFEAVRASGISAVFFIAPVSEEIRNDPDSNAAYQDIVAAVREMKAQYESSSIRVITELAPSVERSIRHNDRIHMIDPGLFPGMLADNIAVVGGSNE